MFASPPASWVATTANTVPPMAMTRNCAAPPQAPAIEPPITPASDEISAIPATQAKKTHGMPLAVLSGTWKPASDEHPSADIQGRNQHAQDKKEDREQGKQAARRRTIAAFEELGRAGYSFADEIGQEHAGQYGQADEAAPRQPPAATPAT